MKYIDAKTFKEILISGAHSLENQKERINALNVFPVPDGDTGTNMAATVMYGVKDLNNISDKSNISEIANKVASNTLLGARGNSGVILSQIFKGISLALAHNTTQISVFDFVEAFKQAADKAYSSVLKPVEGTLLTVIREVSENLEKNIDAQDGLIELFTQAVKFARISCDNTPNLLPVLKEVGVTDSGGEGLVCIIEGMLLALQGNPVTISESDGEVFKFISSSEVFEGEFGYCTEFILNLKRKFKSFNKDNFVKRLEKNYKAKSLVIVQDEKLVKVHSHVLNPGIILNFAQEYGEFIKIKIDNMTEQANESKISQNKSEEIKSKKTKSGIISCNNGQGIINLIKERGVHFVIESGQTNNPSTKDILDAIAAVNSDVIFILPNNSNIIMAAQQAAQTIKDKKIIVIPSKSQVQGIASLTYFNESADWQDNKELINNIIENIQSIEITQAVKTTKINNVNVKENDYLSIVNNNVVDVGKNAVEATIKAIDKAISEDSELITIFYGIKGSRTEANEIKDYIEDKYDVEVEIYSGNQDVYNFLLSIE